MELDVCRYRARQISPGSVYWDVCDDARIMAHMCTREDAEKICHALNSETINYTEGLIDESGNIL